MEHCLLLVSLSDTYVVVPPTDVKLGEKMHLFSFINKFLDQGQWVFVLDCSLIEDTAVLNRA